MSDTSGPAFPVDGFDFRTGQAFQAIHYQGMTLRDYFAAKAMQGILAGDHPITHDHDCLNLVAITAYKQADAMLEARK